MPPMPEARRRRGPPARLLLLVAALVLSAALAEGVLVWRFPRRLYDQLDVMSPRMFRASPVTVFDLLPGARTELVNSEFSHSIAINAQGLRMDSEAAADVPPGRARILIVGDSFVFGWGVRVEEAFASQLQRRLGERGEPVEVLNLGFAMGTAPDTYYAGLRGDPRFDADAVVISVFVDNDIGQPGFNDWPELDARGLPVRVTNELLRVDAQHRLRLAETQWRYRLPGLRNSHLAIGLAELAEAAGLFESAETADPRMEYTRHLYTEQWTPWMEESFGRIVRCLVGLRDLARERDQEFLVTVIPVSSQVYRESVERDASGPARVVRRLRMRPEDGVPQRRLREALAQAGIEVFDLLPSLVRASDLELYFRLDPHFDANGHRVAAAALHAELERRGWLGREGRLRLRAGSRRGGSGS